MNVNQWIQIGYTVLSLIAIAGLFLAQNRLAEQKAVVIAANSLVAAMAAFAFLAPVMGLLANTLDLIQAQNACLLALTAAMNLFGHAVAAKQFGAKIRQNVINSVADSARAQNA